MSGVLLLAWRSLQRRPLQGCLLALALAVAAGLPLGVQELVARYRAELGARAAATPLVLGASGSSSDLVLHALAFRAAPPGTIAMAQMRRVADAADCLPLPLMVDASVDGAPLVGCAWEYFAFRGLRVQRGALPLRVGDCVVGARVAADRRVAVGDRVATDPGELLDIAGGYSRTLHVTGILAANGSADDDAIFCDLRSAWAVAGELHAHEDPAAAGPGMRLRTDAERVVASAALPLVDDLRAVEDWHRHGDADDLPLSAVILQPRSDADAALLRAAQLDEHGVQVVRPSAVIDELVAVVLRIEGFLKLQYAMVLGVVVLLLALLLALEQRLRRHERAVLVDIGCSRASLLGMVLAEWAMVFVAAVALVAVAAWLLLPPALRWLMEWSLR